MSEKPSGSDLAREGLDLWTSGNLEAAETKYRQALEQAPAGHSSIPHVRAQLACVLAPRGFNEEARSQFELTLVEELAEGEANNPAVRVARYFLGNHLLRIGDAAAALAAIRPVLGEPDDFCCES